MLKASAKYLPAKSVPTLDIAYGDAGWKVHSSLIGSFSFGTLPKTSEEAQTCTTASGANCLSASRTLNVPCMLVSKVSSGDEKLVLGKLCAAR